MSAGPGAIVLGTGLVLPGHPAGSPDLEDLPSPLRAAVRRMDRYARTAYLAGCRAAISGGLTPAAGPDPGAGVLLGTTLGCRDSITTHEALVRDATSVADLRPSVFAQTVHNAPAGELAIAWALGGVSETLVCGTTAGLEAILLASWKVADGLARLLLAGGAEGIVDEARSLREELDGRGPAARGLPLVEAAGVLLLGDADGCEGRRPLARVTGGGSYREATVTAAAARLAESVRAALGDPPDLLVVASPDPVGALARAVSPRRARDLAGESGEMLGAGGAVGAVLAVHELAAGDARTAAVVTRDESGTTAFLLLERAARP